MLIQTKKQEHCKHKNTSIALQTYIGFSFCKESKEGLLPFNGIKPHTYSVQYDYSKDQQASTKMTALTNMTHTRLHTPV